MTGVFLALLACAALGLLWVLWSLFRAVCRKLRLSERTQTLIAIGFCFALVAMPLVAILDPLCGIEKTCKSELLKSERMVGTSGLVIEKHYDFWTKTMSGGGWFMPWVSRPYTTPKVEMEIEFIRDGEKHRAWIKCDFVGVPDSGSPPQLAFQNVEFVYDNVLNQRNQFVPWHPPKKN
jgi:hypothetical protein